MRLLLAVLALGTAGCIAPASDVVPDAVEGAAAAPLLDLLAHGCNEAGAVTLNPTLGALDVLPEPWTPADTTPYLGVDAEPGNIGVYHAAYECHEWTVNGDVANHPGGGFVGIFVEPPPFEGVEPVEHNVLVATFATRDRELHRVLGEAGLYVYNAMARVGGSTIGDRWLVQAILNTEGDGIYESDLAMEPGPAIDVLRLWLIVDGPDGKLHPAHLDIRQEGGTRWMGAGHFQHTLNADHPGGAAANPAAGLGFSDVTREMTFGVLPDVLEEMWDH